jgi:hypothetical protein
MGEGRKRFDRAFGEVIGRKADKLRLVPAALGAYVNGQKTVKVAGRPDFVWARIRTATSEIVQVYNDKVSLIWDLPVLIYRDPEAPDIWRIHGRDVRRYQDWGGVSSIPPHGSSHSFSSADRGASDPVWVYKRQFMPFLPHPAVSGSMSMYIEPDFYQWDGLYHWFPGTGTADLTSHKPTGIVNARFVTVYLNSLGGLSYLDGPEFPAFFPPADPGQYISIPAPGVGIPIAAAVLMTGTSFIGWGEIYDLRYPMTSLNGSGSFLPIYDEGVSVGEAESLDFLGQYVSVTMSGSRGVVRVLPPGEDQIGFDVMNHAGVFLGTGHFLVPVYGLEMTLISDIASIFITPPISGSIQAWDDGVIQGSFPIIDFGNNLTITASGSVLRVDASAGGGAGGSGTFALYDEGNVLGSVSELDFAGLAVSVTISGSRGLVNVVMPGSGSTYTRAGVPTALATATGIYWRVPDQYFATGSLSVMLNGVWQQPGVDYSEQFSASGTFQFLNGGPPTGSVLASIWGMPAGGAGLTPPPVLAVTTGTFEVRELLYDATIVSPTGSIVFAPISQLFDHLAWEMSARGSAIAAGVDVQLAINLDNTQANYRNMAHVAIDGTHNIFPGDNNNVTSMPAASALANVFGWSEGEIPFYAQTGIHQMFRAFTSERRAAASTIFWNSHVNYELLGRINSLQFIPASGLFASGTHIRLYGIGNRSLVTSVRLV